MQSLYSSSVNPSSGLTIPQQWQKMALSHLPSMNPAHAGPVLPTSQQWQVMGLGQQPSMNPLYARPEPTTSQHLQAMALGQFSSMNSHYTGTGLSIAQQWHARPLGNLPSAPHYTTYGLLNPQLLQPSSIHNIPICAKSVLPDHQGEFYSIKAFRCGPTTWPAAAPQNSATKTLSLRPDHSRKMVELFYNNICKSRVYPETVLDSSVPQKLYYNHARARLEFSRTNRSTVKIEFDNGSELLNFLELYKT